MVAGFLGAQAPKRREEVGRGLRRGAEKLLRLEKPDREQCLRPSPKGTLSTLQFIARLTPAPARTPSIIAHLVGHIHPPY